MPKNIVFIHLESVSNLILWQYRVELATVWRLWRESRRFTRFYTSATSTEMSLDSLNLGTSFFRDYQSRYARLPNDPVQGFCYLQSRLADELNYTCPYFAWSSLERSPLRFDGSWWRANDITLLRGKIREVIRESVAAKQPFLFLMFNDITHMASDSVEKVNVSSFSERFRNGYLALDEHVKFVLAQLAEADVLDDTILVCYGDHGDELWSHSLSKGFCHGTTPYSPLVWTPLFIYDNGRDAGDDDRLVSLIDIKSTIMNRLVPGFQPTKTPALDAAPFSGIDVFAEKRELAFSQNLFALQLEYGDYEKALTKGYSVTDGVWRLVAASGGRRPYEGGLELFHDRLDPMNTRNILDFFRMDDEGDIVGPAPVPKTFDPGFAATFTPDAVAEITEAYRRLRRELHAYVRAKETEAAKYATEKTHVMPEAAFRQVRKRLRKDYNE